MKIKKPDIDSIKNLYNKGKKAATEAMNKAAEKAKPIIEDVKQEVKQAAEKIDPAFEEAKQAGLKATFFHKTETYAKKAADAQKAYFVAQFNENSLKAVSKDGVAIYKAEKQTEKALQNAQNAVEKYKNFAQREAAAQAAFEQLNK